LEVQEVEEAAAEVVLEEGPVSAVQEEKQKL
jgi:hypothetical protein